MTDELWTRVSSILADKLGPTFSAADISPESRLREDLGLSSLRTIDLVITFEDTFDLSIPEDDVAGLKTVGDIVETLRMHING